MGRRSSGPSFGELEDLYTRYAPAVLGFLRGRGVPDAEDVLGEVFVSVVRSLDRFDGDEDAFRRWLFTIAHRRAVDAHRRRARRPEHAVAPEDLPEVGSASRGPDELVAEGLEGSGVAGALERLTDDQRAVLLLRVVADLSVADTAVVLDKPPSAVKALYRRAVAALGRALLLLAVS